MRKYGAGAKKPTPQELSEAQNALKALKMKMSNAPKPKAPAQRAAPQGGRFVPTFDIEQQMQAKGAGGYSQGYNQGYGGLGGASGGYEDNYNDMYGGNDYGYSQPKPNVAKKPAATVKKPAGNSLRAQKPAVSKKPMGGGMGGGMGGFGGKGMVDNRPLGGGGAPPMMDQGAAEPTYPCPDCGRTFIASTLEKHVKICKKVFQKKRKAFNSQKSRMNDAEQLDLMKFGQKMEKKNPVKPKKNNWRAQSEEFQQMLKANRGLKMPGADSWGMGGGFGGMGGGFPSSGGGSLDRYKGARGNYGPSSYGSSTKPAGRAGAKPNLRGAAKTGGAGMGMGMQQAPMRSAIADQFTLCKFCNRRYNDEAYAKHLPGCERRYKEAQIRNKLAKPAKRPGKK